MGGNLSLIALFPDPPPVALSGIAEDKAPTVIGRGAGGFDGVVMAGRRLLVASQTDSSVSSYESGQAVRLISGLPDPATIGYDAKRNRVLIPLLSTNRVEIWQLP